MEGGNETNSICNPLGGKSQKNHPVSAKLLLLTRLTILTNLWRGANKSYSSNKSLPIGFELVGTSRKFMGGSFQQWIRNCGRNPGIPFLAAAGSVNNSNEIMERRVLFPGPHVASAVAAIVAYPLQLSHCAC